MVRRSKLIILYVLIIVILLFAGAAYFYRTQNGDSIVNITDEQLDCEASGGEWREFPNSCVDSCSLERNPEVISCAQVLTFGCDCGDDMCWNGESCEQN